MSRLQHGRLWSKWQVTEMTIQGEKELVYHNNRYHVFYRKHPPLDGAPFGVIHLSIKNNDRSHKHDWRDLQRIKNEIVGEEYQMVEVFPRECDKVDLSNQFHLWGFDTKEPILARFGFGWHGQRLVWSGTGPRPDIEDADGAVQRPHDEETTVKTK